ncbi:MAG TPA: cation diffusion facilitator family transporter [Gemmatimonadaceae bacterium]|nr:cation diffusion facilitator family transporter [Gemmatimonadaceae bacterium]
MSHVHVHDHSLPHLHDHAHHSHQGRLRWALVLTAVFFVAEVAGGVISNSLALLADAGHMFTDVGALALSLFVAWFSRQPAAPEKTYGYLRLEILAALLNGAVLLLVSGLIVWEAIGRLQAPEPLQGGLMLGVALGGLLINAASAAILHPVHGHSLNARGAYLHVIGDLLGSVGTVIAALVVRTTGWLTADPIASMVVTLLVVRSAWRLVRESVDVLLEATPAHISLGRVREGLQSIAGIESVHDLHVWTVTSGMVAMSAHAVVKEPGANQQVLEAAVAAMQRLGISHVTLQVERDRICEAPCA